MLIYSTLSVTYSNMDPFPWSFSSTSEFGTESRFLWQLSCWHKHENILSPWPHHALGITTFVTHEAGVFQTALPSMNNPSLFSGRCFPLREMKKWGCEKENALKHLSLTCSVYLNMATNACEGITGSQQVPVLFCDALTLSHASFSVCF